MPCQKHAGWVSSSWIFSMMRITSSPLISIRFAYLRNARLSKIVCRWIDDNTNSKPWAYQKRRSARQYHFPLDSTRLIVMYRHFPTKTQQTRSISMNHTIRQTDHFVMLIWHILCIWRDTQILLCFRTVSAQGTGCVSHCPKEFLLPCLTYITEN